MASKQLHLFDPPRPLLERLGEDFFRAAPRCPGIYIMTGQNDRVLYIGQSKNLRVRLASYKNARPDRASRKTVRLVRQVRSIAWEICATPAAAQLRENALLRLHRPKFNVQNTYPRAYSFIWIRCNSDELELGRTHDTEVEFSGSSALQFYGAFKTRAVAGYSALLRLLWAALHKPVSTHAFPNQLLALKPPRQYRLKFPRTDHTTQLLESLRHCLEGSSDNFLTLLAEALPAGESLSPFHRTLQSTNLETLAEFYRSGPRRNFILKSGNELHCSIIPQEQLDDLLVLSRSPQRVPEKP